jgi:two-component system nitrate/nitrite response regulator NarL
MHHSKYPTAASKPTVVVADATLMDCQLVTDAIERHDRFRVIGRATSSSEIVATVRELQPKVVVISARLQDGTFAGLLALRGLRALSVPTRIVMLLDKDERELIVEAFLNNVRGVFCRIGSSQELRTCIQRVHDGQIWINNAQLEYIVEALMQAPALRGTNGRVATVLSKREEEIAQLVALGLSNRDISGKLELSQHTVKNHLSRIFEKVGISTRIELLLYILSHSKPSSSDRELGLDFPAQMSA